MSEELRGKVGLLLARGLFAATGGPADPDLSDEPPPDRDEDIDPWSEGALLAVEALGLLSAEEVARWRLRHTIAARGWAPGPPAEPERTRLAERHMDRLGRELAAATEEEDRGAALRRIHGAGSLYVYTGLVQPELPADHGPGDEGEWCLGIPMGADDRVAAAQLVRHDGLCLTSVLLGERGFELRWHAITEGPLVDDGLERFGGFAAEDDVGTEYGPVVAAGASWSASDGPQVVTGSSWCATPVPDAASELRVRRDEAVWLVPVA